MPYSFSFEYNEKGFGELLLINEHGSPEMTFASRTGSLGEDGRFAADAQPIRADLEWYIIDDPKEPEPEEFDSMAICGIGWKQRLYYSIGDEQYHYDGHLIHPDGGKPGTLGCIGIIGTSADYLRDKIVEIRNSGQKTIPVYINRKDIEVA